MQQAIHAGQATGNGLATRGMPMVLMYHSVQPYTEDPDTSPRLWGKAMRHWLTWGYRGPGAALARPGAA